jgi:hypothetical protein
LPARNRTSKETETPTSFGRNIWSGVFSLSNTSFPPYVGSMTVTNFKSYSTTKQFKNQGKNKKKADINTENADLGLQGLTIFPDY